MPRINAPLASWTQIDGQTAKCLSIQQRRRDYVELRRIGYQSGTRWQHFKRRVQAWLSASI